MSARTKIGLYSVAACALLLATLWGVWTLSKASSFQFFGTAIARFDSAEPVVALTFDDGPSPKYLTEVLDSLRQENVLATFYLVGEAVQDHPDAVQAIAAAGHEIGNHSMTHPRMVFMRPSNIARQIEHTDAALRATGYDGPLTFRPPYGMKLFTLSYYLSKTNRPSIMWDIAPEQWTGPIEMRAERVAESAKPGSIILLHVMWDHSQGSRDFLRPMIQALKAKGFGFDTVSNIQSGRQKAASRD